MPSSLAVSGAPSPRRQVDRRRLALFAVRYGLFLALGLWMVVMTIASEHFLSWLNFLNVLRQAAPVVIVAVGMTLVMATAGIDLSVGSLVALVSVLAAAWLRRRLAGLGRDPGDAGGRRAGRPGQRRLRAARAARLRSHAGSADLPARHRVRGQRRLRGPDR